MIRFACTCGKRLQVSDDQAGGSVQCPACGLLTDVPNFSDLQSFTEDGTYRLDADRGPFVDDPARLDELGLIYSKDKRDAEGNEIDLRTLPGGQKFYADDDQEAGELELKPREPAAEDVTNRPKYDPETGELIKPLEVRKDPGRDVDPASIPVAKAALNYAARDLSRRVSPVRVAVELFMPMNLVVMFFIFAMHLFVATIFIAAWILFFLWPALAVIQGLIVSHYGNVIDDTARNEQEDLPRPLRNLDLYDDIWSPFVAMFGGFMIAFAVPALIVGSIAERSGLPIGPMAVAGGIVGTLLAPAVLLTTNTSGSVFNLRPDRLLKVIRVCGLHYLVVVVLFAVAWPIYLFGAVGVCFALLGTFLGSASRMDGPLVEWLLVMPALLGGIYLMHWFCWYLGILYKAHHAEFPWVLQRYIRDPRDRVQGTHADKLRRRRPAGGHLIPPPPPPPGPPPGPTRHTSNVPGH
jgi:hypothetical protein